MALGYLAVLALLLLAAAAANSSDVGASCLTRRTCNATEACANDRFELRMILSNQGAIPGFSFTGYGTCSPCQDVSGPDCCSPCYLDQNTCKADQVSFDLQLDLAAPYYLYLVSSVTKTVFNVVVFTPMSQEGWGGLKTILRVLYFVMMLNTGVIDVMNVRNVWCDPSMAWYKALYYSCVVISTSSNLVTSFSLLGLFMNNMSPGPDAWTERGIGEWVYLQTTRFLLIFYFAPGCLLTLLSVPPAICYCWIFVPFGLLALALLHFLTKPTTKVARYLMGDHVPEELRRSLLDDPEHRIWSRPTGEDSFTLMEKLIAYSMVATIIAFLMPLQARALSGFGYMPSFLMTLRERHIAVYLNGVRESPSRLIDFTWLLL